jgi:hypothetical protein
MNINNIEENQNNNIEENQNNNIENINKFINELGEESDDSINTNYFTEKEQNKINNINSFNKYIYYICLLFGFYLIIVCNYNGLSTLFFEVILNLFIPYLFIPIKLFMCKKNLTKICIPL